jgi:DNA-3-methyladenine glycosylase
LKKLDASFYHHGDVTDIARALIGMVIVTRWDDITTAGRIVETEAYRGETDRASHAWGGRRTNRTEVMYGPGGYAYVYLCYGIHHLVNVVTHDRGVPHAVLLRAMEPLEGITEMVKRTGKPAGSPSLGAGPGNLSRALGIHTRHSGYFLRSRDFFLADDGSGYAGAEILATPRIGVDYAGADAKLPYRFIVAGSPWISVPNAFKPSAKPAHG